MPRHIHYLRHRWQTTRHPWRRRSVCPDVGGLSRGRLFTRRLVGLASRVAHSDTAPVTWQVAWLETFGEAPLDRTSREVSVQEVLAQLIAGRKTAWFEPYAPTEKGERFLLLLWCAAFGNAPAGSVNWFVSEYPLPVPLEWRTEIGLTYGCPDLACAVSGHVLIVELKTERGSFRARQMSDYLRLARRRHREEWTDVALLGPTRPGDMPPHDDRQRYSELTWRDAVPLIRDVFSNDLRAQQLVDFLQVDLASGVERPQAIIPSGTRAPAARSEPGDEADAEACVAAAVAHARRMAPSVARAVSGDRTERGVDVAFESDDLARRAQLAVKHALEGDGLEELVTVWLWRPQSGGRPATPAGLETGRELRLAPSIAPRGRAAVGGEPG
jgi:hypothetical protein